MNYCWITRVCVASLVLLASLARAATVNAAFTTAATVPVTSAGYSASGNDLNLSLGFSASRGTSLTVVDNTGRSFISGRFSNLAHGQVVNLRYGATTYRFIANYYGGTGNDLVLQWGFQTACSWGDNTDGQLGNNSTTDSKVPVAVTSSGVLSGKTVVAVAAGSDHSLALCSDGTVAAWGNNSTGQLGNDSTTASSVPVAVDRTGVLANKTVVALAAGQNHSLALCSDGTVAAWGLNYNGQLGSLGSYDSDVPVTVYQSGVLSGKTVVAVAAGSFHSLALCSDGTLVAWGSDSFGQLGNGTAGPTGLPLLVDRSGALSGKSVVAVAAGSSHSFAVCADGTVATWGANSAGQLGAGSGAGSTAPVLATPTGGLSGRLAKSAEGGGGHSLAVNSNGTMAAWGANSDGQLGDGTNFSSNLAVAVTTTGVLSGKTAIAAAAGDSHSLALCTDGTLVSWGDNGFGQLGDNTITNSSNPVAITASGYFSGKTPAAIAAGRFHSLGVASSPVSNPTNESSLVSLTLSSGSLSPSFTSGHTAYTASVPTTTSAITVTSTVANPSATLKVNGVTVASAAASAAIPLSYGTNAISVVVKAPDGVTTTTYSVNITRTPPSAVCTLSSLVLSDGTLSPVFDPATAAYFVRVSNAVSAITLTPTVTDSNSNLTVNGSALTSGTSSQPIALSVGSNTLSIRVTAQDGTTTKTYTVVMIRAPSPASLLTDLSLSAGTLSPAFRSGVIDYAACVSSDASSITLTPTAADPSAAIMVNGSIVASGSLSQPIALSVGSNTVLVKVTAPDTSFTSYSVQIVRPSSLNFTYTAATDVPAEFPAYDATGLSTNLSLGFAPAPGSNLTVIRNTGTNFIQGRFLNLAHGQKINLTYNGIPYRFVVNYHGGTGNDLVLQWANQSICSWGYNAHGELGNNDTTNSAVAVDVTVSAALEGKIVTMVAAGGTHSLALCSDGSMSTWGYNSYGQLGNGSTASRNVPGPVTVSPALTGKTVVSVASGNHNLTLCADGTLVAWGYNYNGQLGNGGTSSSSIPVQVLATGALAGKTVVAAAVGDSHSLALCSDGTLAAWGNNASGQLGNNSTSSSTTPVAVNTTGLLADKTVIAIAAGGSGNMALCSDGTLAGWGSGLGNGGNTFSKVPVVMDTSGSLSGKFVTAITAGTGHRMALCSDGTLAAWGANNYGQLGNSTTTLSSIPVIVNRSGVLSGKTITQLAAGDGHSLAHCSDGTVAAWGRGNIGALGNGGTDLSSVPVAVDNSGVLSQKSVMTVAAGGFHSLALAATSSPVPANDYELWLEEHLDWSNPPPNADSDHDDIPNLMEYVLNSNPTAASHSSLPIMAVDDENFIFAFIRRAGSALETTQIFQYGTSLDDWSDVRISAPVDPEVTLGTVDGMGNQNVTITIPKAPHTRIFGRLQVTRP